jgi:hypothetical protein
MIKGPDTKNIAADLFTITSVGSIAQKNTEFKVLS